LICNVEAYFLLLKSFEYIIFTLLSFASHLKWLKFVFLFRCFGIIKFYDEPFLHFGSHRRHQDFVVRLFVPQTNALELLLLQGVVKVGSHDQEVLHARNTGVDTVIDADVELTGHLFCQFDELIEVDAIAAVLKQNLDELANLFSILILELYQI
jgi:hypothetical protein